MKIFSLCQESNAGAQRAFYAATTTSCEQFEFKKSLIYPYQPNFCRIHALKTTDDLKPFHDRLEMMFKQMQVQVEEKYGKGRCDISLKRSSNESIANLEGRSSPQVKK